MNVLLKGISFFYNSIILGVKNSFFCKNKKDFVMECFSRSRQDRTFVSWHMLGCTWGFSLPTNNFIDL